MRAAVLAAVVSGLFVMHGTSAAAGGCHEAGAMPDMAAMRMPAPLAAAAHGTRPAPGPVAAVNGHSQVEAAAGGGVVPLQAALCLSTAPRTLLVLALLAASGLLVAGWERRLRCHVRRAWAWRVHAPPGRALLTGLCVART